MDSLEKEVDFEDYCPWLEEEEQDQRVVVFNENEEEGTDPEVEGPDMGWVVLDELGEESEEESVEEIEDAEDVEVVDRQSTKRKRTIVCPICQESVIHLARHALAHHLPWFWGPYTACWECRDQLVATNPYHQHLAEEHQGQGQIVDPSMLASLVRGFLETLMSWLNFSSLERMRDSLCNNVTLHEICKKKSLTTNDLDLCRAVDQEEPFHSTPAYTILDGNQNFTVFALLHWRVILQLLTSLTFEQQVTVRNFGLDDIVEPAPEVISEPSTPEAYSEPMSPEVYSLPSSPASSVITVSEYQDPECSTSTDEMSTPVHIIDSHLHMDHLLNRAGIPGLQELDLFEVQKHFHTNLSTLISNYCFPDFWPKKEDRARLLSSIPELHFSFGIHPKSVQSSTEEVLEEYMDTLEELIKTERTVSIGECGLDTSNTSIRLNLNRQILFLERQLELAVVKNLPVVIHCRGNTSLHFQLFSSLQKICPPEHPIHWHCFSGIQQVYSKATAYFSNIVFGITPHIFTKPYIADFVHINSTDNLVLETDSPFIYYNHQPSTPFHVNYVAQRISETLDQPFNDVVSITTRNVQRIYQL